MSKKFPMPELAVDDRKILKQKRSQAFLRNAKKALAKMKDKRLCRGAMYDGKRCCLVGATVLEGYRDKLEAKLEKEGGTDLLSYLNCCEVPKLVNISPILEGLVVKVNDDRFRNLSESDRYLAARQWVNSVIEKD